MRALHCIALPHMHADTSPATMDGWKTRTGMQPEATRVIIARYKCVFGPHWCHGQVAWALFATLVSDTPGRYYYGSDLADLLLHLT